MMKRSTWIWLILFLVAIGIFLYLQYRPAAPAEPTPTAVASRYLFNENDGALVGIRINNDQDDTVELERPSGGLWIVVLPAPGPADQAKAEAGATQIGALLILNTIEASQARSAMGLDIPAYMIEVTFQDGTKHELEIGKKTPTDSGYYVCLDSNQVYIVSSDGIDALINLLKTPPYLPSTSTPIPTLDTSITPTSNVLTP